MDEGNTNANGKDFEKTVGKVNVHVTRSITAPPSTSTKSGTAAANATGNGAVGSSVATTSNLGSGASSLSSSSSSLTKGKNWNKNKKKEQGKQSQWQQKGNQQHFGNANNGKNKFDKNQHGQKHHPPVPGGRDGQKTYNKKAQSWRDHSAAGGSGASGTGFQPHFSKNSGINGYHRQDKEQGIFSKGNNVALALQQRPPFVNREEKEAGQAGGNHKPFPTSISKGILKSGCTFPAPVAPTSKPSSTMQNKSIANQAPPFASKDEMIKSIMDKFCGLSRTQAIRTTFDEINGDNDDDEPQVSQQSKAASVSESGPMAKAQKDVEVNNKPTADSKDFNLINEIESITDHDATVTKVADTLEALFIGSASHLQPTSNKNAVYHTDVFKDLDDIFGTTSKSGQNPLSISSSPSASTSSSSPTIKEGQNPTASMIRHITPIPVVTTSSVTTALVSVLPSIILPPPAAAVIASTSGANANNSNAPLPSTVAVTVSTSGANAKNTNAPPPSTVAAPASTSGANANSSNATPPSVITARATSNPSVAITTTAQPNESESNDANAANPRLPLLALLQKSMENKEKRKAEAALALAQKEEKKLGGRGKGKFTKNVTNSLFNRENVHPSIIEQTRKLPIYSKKDELIKLVRENQFVIVIGDTGCGKSTQIPQYIAEAGLHRKGMIGVTQPRRVAAKSLAIRVAAEGGVRLGSTVGYSVRFDKNVTEKTVIKYMTNGTLVKECTCSDAGLDEYTVIMIDEAHERRIDTDVCLGLLKQAAAKRPELKVIISSTTLEEEKFSQFFNNAPVFRVPGEGYKVQIQYEPQTEFNYMESAANAVIYINSAHPRGTSRGDILVFLPGQEEIDEIWSMLEKKIKKLPSNSLYDDLIIAPCYRGMLLEDQQQIFDPTPKNCRKVVLATNIAETSITIDGIVYVIDCGFFKQNQYNPETGIYSLVTRRITKFQAIQRAGRAGRNCAGICYRLFKEEDFLNKMEETEEPEVMRSSLESMILSILSLGIADPRDFPLMDAPPDEALVRAIFRLQDLSAIEVSADGIKLTDLGRCMVEFPLDPPLAKVVIESEKLGCSTEVLKIVSMLSFHSIFLRNRRNKNESDAAKQEFDHPDGDLLTLLNVHNEWEKKKRSESWSKSRCLNFGHLMETDKIQGQIKKVLNGRRKGVEDGGFCESMSLPPSNDLNLEESIRKAFTAGYFHQLAKKAVTKNDYQVLGNEMENELARLHPSSSLREKMPPWVIYQQIMTTRKTFMKEVTVIDPSWIKEYAPDFAEKVAAFGVPT